jgi:tetratricopeptide (TPR) repeat protein
VTLAPDDEIAVRRLIQTLDRFGDRRGALRIAEDFTRRLSQEFDAVPSAETQSVIAAVRANNVAPAFGAAEVEPRADTPDLSVSTPTVAHNAPAPAVARAPSRRRRTLSVSRSALGVALVGAVVVIALLDARHGGAMSGPASPVHVTSPPVTIASAVARRLYDEGLNRFEANDFRESARLFHAALAADSGCAMCAYYAGLAEPDFDSPDADRMLRLGLRLADRVSEPERLLIRFRWADATNSPTRRAVADSLVSLYPAWPDAQHAAADAAMMAGDWLAALGHLRRVLAARPVPDSISAANCPPCLDVMSLITAYVNADSLPAALRVAQAFERAHPRSYEAWKDLARTLTRAGRYDEARAAIDSATRYAAGTDAEPIEHALIEIQAGNFATADALLGALTQAGNPDSRAEALWYASLSLRTQGRLREALRMAEGPMRQAEVESPTHAGSAAIVEAQVRFELGQYRRAAEQFISLAAPMSLSDTLSEGFVARRRCWMLTHAGSAFAAEGDTIALAALADSVEAWGKFSGFGRDGRLHEYLRGLVWMARARPDSAMVAFGAAMFVEGDGFSRLNLQLARALVSLGRPSEAIYQLEESLQGGPESGNFYATRTELEQELARTYEAAGRPDSAAVYYRRVIQAWRNADPQFVPEVAQARARLAADERRAIAQH